MIRRIVALALAVLLPVLLGASECEEGDTHPSAPRVPEVPRQPATPATKRPPQPDPHEGDPQPSGHKTRNVIISFRVGSGDQLPATFHITTLGGSVTPTSHDDFIADTHRTTFTLTFDASAQQDLSIVTQLLTSKGGSGSWCGIEAGTYGNDGPRFTAGKTVTTCYLTIKRPQ